MYSFWLPKAICRFEWKTTGNLVMWLGTKRGPAPSGVRLISNLTNPNARLYPTEPLIYVIVHLFMKPPTQKESKT